MAKFMVRKRLPAAPAPKPMRSKSEGRMAPRMAMTMPKTKIPAQAESWSRATQEAAGRSDAFAATHRGPHALRRALNGRA